MLHIQCEETAERHQLQLAGELTIYTAADLKPQLLQALTECTALDLHLGQISELDTAGLQQLLLARREAARLGKTLRLLEPSAAAREVLAFMQLDTAFSISYAEESTL
jgi:anti-anti-sigma factor